MSVQGQRRDPGQGGNRPGLKPRPGSKARGLCGPRISGAGPSRALPLVASVWGAACGQAPSEPCSREVWELHVFLTPPSHAPPFTRAGLCTPSGVSRRLRKVRLLTHLHGRMRLLSTPGTSLIQARPLLRHARLCSPRPPTGHVASRSLSGSQSRAGTRLWHHEVSDRHREVSRVPEGGVGREPAAGTVGSSFLEARTVGLLLAVSSFASTLPHVSSRMRAQGDFPAVALERPGKPAHDG